MITQRYIDDDFSHWVMVFLFPLQSLYFLTLMQSTYIFLTYFMSGAAYAYFPLYLVRAWYLSIIDG